jgi:branched-chain amino acid transport system ATP-binding protein
MPEALLEVKDLHGWYGESHVLHGMSFSVPGSASTIPPPVHKGNRSSIRHASKLTGVLIRVL